jgi:hypothetical protein
MKIILKIVNDVTYTHTKFYYSLQLILLVANMDVSITKIYLDTSIFVESNMGRRGTKFLYCGLHKNNKL